MREQLQMRRFPLSDLPEMPSLPPDYTLRELKPPNQTPFSVARRGRQPRNAAWYTTPRGTGGEVPLTVLSSDDLEPLAALLRTAFETPSWTPERVHAEFVAAEGVQQTFVIAFKGRPVATASALLLPEPFPGSGIVHWVAADPAHKGRRLGYCVSLAVLHLFARIGCRDALLKTDDERLAAIQTYLNLGFAPDNCHPSHPQRWERVFAALAAANRTRSER